MRPASLMIVGATVGIFQLFLASLLPLQSQADFTVLVFAAGALFGKGYGIWEARDGTE